MFMGIAAFLLNVVIGRLVAMQREQIATLKAFGYSNLAVLWHYLKMVSVIVALGVVSGTALGVWLGQVLAGIYMEFYHFPYLKFSLQPTTVLEATVASLLAAGATRRLSRELGERIGSEALAVAADADDHATHPAPRSPTSCSVNSVF